MTKRICLTLVLTLCIGLFGGCGRSMTDSVTSTESTETSVDQGQHSTEKEETKGTSTTIDINTGTIAELTLSDLAAKAERLPEQKFKTIEEPFNLTINGITVFVPQSFASKKGYLVQNGVSLTSGDYTPCDVYVIEDMISSINEYIEKKWTLGCVYAFNVDGIDDICYMVGFQDKEQESYFENLQRIEIYVPFDEKYVHVSVEYLTTHAYPKEWSFYIEEINKWLFPFQKATLLLDDVGVDPASSSIGTVEDLKKQATLGDTKDKNTYFQEREFILTEVNSMKQIKIRANKDDFMDYDDYPYDTDTCDGYRVNARMVMKINGKKHKYTTSIELIPNSLNGIIESINMERQTYGIDTFGFIQFFNVLGDDRLYLAYGYLVDDKPHVSVYSPCENGVYIKYQIIDNSQGALDVWNANDLLADHCLTAEFYEE